MKRYKYVARTRLDVAGGFIFATSAKDAITRIEARHPGFEVTELEEAHEYADKPEPRYYIAEREQIIAVRDRAHPDYNPDELGVNSPDVVWYTLSKRSWGIAGTFNGWEIDDATRQEAQEALAAFQNGKFEKAVK